MSATTGAVFGADTHDPSRRPPVTVRLAPHLGFDSEAREAMHFYRSVFGGELTISTYAEGGMSLSGDDEVTLRGKWDGLVHGDAATVPLEQTGPVPDRIQSEVAARIPGAAALGLVLPPRVDVVPATCLADAGWTADVIARRDRGRQGTGDRRVRATVWWYSASTVLVTPALAGLVTGRPLSARLEDTALALLPGDQPIAAESSAPGTDVGADLRDALAAVIAAVAGAGRMSERPLWAIATDSMANQLLALGRALGDVPTATSLAGPLAAAIGPPLPAPRYVDVGRSRWTRRASCCLLVEVPGQAMCTSCPRRHPAERRTLLERLS